MKKNKEIKKIEEKLNNLIFSKALMVFSPYGYNLMQYTVYISGYDENLLILDFELYNRKENKEMVFDIVYDFNEETISNSLVLKYYEYDNKSNMLFTIERFYKAVLSDSNVLNNLEYYLFLNNENELN